MKNKEKNDPDSIKITGIFSGLVLIKKQWARFFLAILASFIILSLDFVLTTSIPKIIEGLNVLLNKGQISEVPLLTVIFLILIVLRPIIGWSINFFQIKVLLGILRNLEDDIKNESQRIYLNEKNYSSESSANILVTHGRYYLDNFLIPLIRAITDIGSILVICLGLFIQYPIPLVIFLATIALLLSIYQSVTQKLLQKNGMLLVNSYKDIIKLSEDGFIGSLSNKNIKKVLDIKRRSSLILGSISQGMKYVIEFCFMFSFGVATIYIIMFSSTNFVAFTSTFAYAGIRMLPSFATVLAFYQGKSAADFSIKEVSNHLKNS